MATTTFERRIGVRFSEQTAARLDELARREETSIATLIRRAVRELLAHERREHAQDKK